MINVLSCAPLEEADAYRLRGSSSGVFTTRRTVRMLARYSIPEEDTGGRRHNMAFGIDPKRFQHWQEVRDGRPIITLERVWRSASQ
jgi:hypothetical protein